MHREFQSAERDHLLDTAHGVRPRAWVTAAKPREEQGWTMIKAITQVGPAALAAILLAHGPRAGATGQQPIALSGFPAAMYSLSAVESAPAQDPAAADRTERVVPAPAVQEPERPVELRGKVF